MSQDDKAIIEEGTYIDASSKIWALAQIRKGAVIGKRVNVGAGVYVGVGVEIGDFCKIQNYALIYEPAKLERGVFIGPGVILTNDKWPRAITPENSQKQLVDWEPVGTLIREGASIGARSVCVAPLTIGRWAMVAAGSVVTKNVSDFSLVAGVPARRIGWVGRAGQKLLGNRDDSGLFVCPVTGSKYREQSEDFLIELN